MIPMQINYNINTDYDGINIQVNDSYGGQIISVKIFYERAIQDQIDRMHLAIAAYVQNKIISDSVVQQNLQNYKFNKNIGAV